MNPSSYSLLLGGIASFLITLLHVALAIRPKWWSYCGADQLAALHEQGSPFVLPAAIGLALMFGVWGVYALSGAGLIGPLPLLRGVLITIGVIYVLRGLMLPSEIVQVLTSGHPFRFVVFSTGCLAIGGLHLFGALAR